MAGACLQDLKKQGLPPNPLFSCPGSVLTGWCSEFCIAWTLRVAQEVCGNVMWEPLEWLDWDFQVEEC